MYCALNFLRFCDYIIATYYVLTDFCSKGARRGSTATYGNSVNYCTIHCVACDIRMLVLRIIRYRQGDIRTNTSWLEADIIYLSSICFPDTLVDVC